MLYLNAFSAKDGPVIRAIEVHYPIVMRAAQFVLDCLRRLIVKIDLTEEWITLHDLIEDVNV